MIQPPYSDKEHLLRNGTAKFKETAQCNWTSQAKEDIKLSYSYMDSISED